MLDWTGVFCLLKERTDFIFWGSGLKATDADRAYVANCNIVRLYFAHLTNLLSLRCEQMSFFYYEHGHQMHQRHSYSLKTWNKTLHKR